MVLLEKVLTENRRLREAIEARDNEQRNVLQELASKMESGLGPERERRKRTRKIPISAPSSLFQKVAFWRRSITKWLPSKKFLSPKKKLIIAVISRGGHFVYVT